jgi:hypothetical protein
MPYNPGRLTAIHHIREALDMMDTQTCVFTGVLSVVVSILQKVTVIYEIRHSN